MISEPQPTPLKTEALPADGKTLIIRTWNVGDVGHCRLCSGCNAFRKKKETVPVMACTTLVPWVVEESEASLFTWRDSAFAGFDDDDDGF